MSPSGVEPIVVAVEADTPESPQSPTEDPIVLADRVLGRHLEQALQLRTRAKGDLRQTRSE